MVNIAEYSNPKNGAKVLVGKTSRDNDILTFEIADLDDIWFHVSNYAGAHVVLKSTNMCNPEEDILYAAGFAAKNSKAPKGEKVRVDYCMVHEVEKPKCAASGSVNVRNPKQIYVKI